MPARDGAAYTPDASRATDATSDLSGREERARTLVRGVDARAAARDALVRASESQDERDTGSQLPVDASRLARNAGRAARRTRGDGAVRGDGATDAPQSTGTQGANAIAGDGWAATAGGRRPIPRGGGTDTPRHERAAGTALASSDGTRPRPRAQSVAGNAPPASTSSRYARHDAVDAQTTRLRGASARSAGTAHDVTPMPGMAPASADPHRRATTLAIGAGRRARRRARVAGRAVAATPAAAAPAAEGAVATAPAMVAVTALVALPLAVVLLGALLGAGSVEEDRLRGARRLAQTAADECRAGESRGDHNHKGIAYSELVRGPGGPRDDWDACFVGWCMERAGFLDADARAAYSSAEACLANFSADGTLGDVHAPDAGPYDPAEGDLVFVPMADGTAHVGIVTSFDGTWLRTVEGDVAGGPRNRYDRDDADGLGGYVAAKVRRRNEFGYTFVRPRYSDEAARARVAQRDQTRD